MAEAAVYPIALHLQDKQVMVVGGGNVATRKVRQLLRSRALVALISPEASGELRSLADSGQIEWIQAKYERDMLNPYMPVLVFAASDDKRVNQIVAQDAHRIRALCNIVDGFGESDFSNMAQIDQPPLTIALSSGGASPALLRQLKSQLEAAISSETVVLSQWLGELRQPLKDELPCQAERQRLYQRLLDSEVPSLLREKRVGRARKLFQSIVAEGAPQ